MLTEACFVRKLCCFTLPQSIDEPLLPSETYVFSCLSSIIEADAPLTDAHVVYLVQIAYQEMAESLADCSSEVSCN